MPTASPNSIVRPYPSQYVSEWMAKDGTQITIRPIQPEDEPLMVKFHETLSEWTVYMRYFSCISVAMRTAHERLARICWGDYQREIVLVADYRDSRTGEHSILGVARLNKLQAGGEAEIAVLVSDQWQHKGMGTELLCRLIQIARDEKLGRLVAEMLRDNLTIQSIFRRLGFCLHLLRDPRLIEAVLDL